MNDPNKSNKEQANQRLNEMKKLVAEANKKIGDMKKALTKATSFKGKKK